MTDPQSLLARYETECRNCGRHLSTVAETREGLDKRAIIRCSECGTTTRTENQTDVSPVMTDGGTAQATADRRFRVFCEACDWHADATHPNSLVARAEAERHDDRVHDGDETADVEVVTGTDEPEIVTDGGREIVEEIAPEDDRVDPERLPDDYTPAYIDVRGQGPVYVANYILLDSGWVSVTEWSGDRSKLPRHRVLALRDVRTERHGEDYHLRVADEDKREQARADYPDRVDGLPLDEDGEIDRVRADGGDGHE